MRERGRARVLPGYDSKSSTRPCEAKARIASHIDLISMPELAKFLVLLGLHQQSALLYSRVVDDAIKPIQARGILALR